MVTELVPREDIEDHVGCPRHDWAHYGRLNSSEHRIYILHSKECLAREIDLRDCEYSKALDVGTWGWEGLADQTVLLMISPLSGKLLARKDNSI